MGVQHIVYRAPWCQRGLRGDTPGPIWLDFLNFGTQISSVNIDVGYTEDVLDEAVMNIIVSRPKYF